MTLGALRERIVLQRADALPVSIATLTRSGTTATATAAAAHGFVTGDYVVVAGATPTGYNGRVQVAVTGPKTWTYPVAGALTTPATGAMTATVLTDAQGGRRTTWSTLDTVWAEAVPLKAWEHLQAEAIQVELTMAERQAWADRRRKEGWSETRIATILEQAAKNLNSAANNLKLSTDPKGGFMLGPVKHLLELFKPGALRSAFNDRVDSMFARRGGGRAWLHNMTGPEGGMTRWYGQGQRWRDWADNWSQRNDRTGGNVLKDRPTMGDQAWQPAVGGGAKTGTKPGQQPDAKTKLPGPDWPKIEQNVTLNLKAELAHKEEVWQGIMQIRAKLIEGLSTSQNETRLMAGMLESALALTQF